MSTLYMIRHGQASFGEHNYDRLSEKGLRQAGILGEHLINTGLRADAVYSWTLQRQLATAQEVTRRFHERGIAMPELALCEALNELDAHAVVVSQIHDMISENPSVKDDLEKIYTDDQSFKRIFEVAMLRWVSGDFEKEGVESWDTFSSKVWRGITEIMSRHTGGKKVFLFTSGGPIAATVQKHLDLSNEHTIRLSWQIANTSVTRFVYNGSGAALAGFNEISHLELQKERDMVTYR
ncbi:MAG TPA: histidine phosphatase family protein [Syntrophales bacterium]|nr:histidine phosphatase family protein [Syntrophales bacterium]HPQ43536.1 histidine phosphatase family protein [Syntrophales bacterium]